MRVGVALLVCGWWVVLIAIYDCVPVGCVVVAGLGIGYVVGWGMGGFRDGRFSDGLFMLV